MSAAYTQAFTVTNQPINEIFDESINQAGN